MEKIKIGDSVNWRGAFGNDIPRPAKVTGIELCSRGQKYGVGVQEIDVTRKDSCVFDLDNGHWCYGQQIEPLEEQPATFNPL